MLSVQRISPDYCCFLRNFIKGKSAHQWGPWRSIPCLTRISSQHLTLSSLQKKLNKCLLKCVSVQETAIIFLTNPTSWWPPPLCTIPVRILLAVQRPRALRALTHPKMHLWESLGGFSASKPMGGVCIFNYGSTAQPDWGGQLSADWEPWG